MRKPSAFTLIELLVVIAIIAILAAILSRLRAGPRKSATGRLSKQSEANLYRVRHVHAGLRRAISSLDSERLRVDAAVNGQTGAFVLAYLYNNQVDPYIKNGVNTTTLTLNGVWACPSAKASLGTQTNTYAYNYYGIGGISNCSGNNTLGAQYAPFNAQEYALPATQAVLGRPSEMILMAEGGQLCRPPVAYVANGSSANNNGIWGSHQRGTGTIAPSAGPSANDTINSLLTGRLTVVAYCDGHVKAVPTMTLVSSKCVMENGAWRGSAVADNTPLGNAGWAHTW